MARRVIGAPTTAPGASVCGLYCLTVDPEILRALLCCSDRRLRHRDWRYVTAQPCQRLLINPTCPRRSITCQAVPAHSHPACPVTTSQSARLLVVLRPVRERASAVMGRGLTELEAVGVSSVSHLVAQMPGDGRHCPQAPWTSGLPGLVRAEPVKFAIRAQRALDGRLEPITPRAQR